MDIITLCSQLQSLVNDMLVQPPIVRLSLLSGDQVRVLLDLDLNTKDNLLISDDFTYSSLVRAVKLHKRCTRRFCPLIPFTVRSSTVFLMIFMYLRVLGSLLSALFDASPFYRKIAVLVVDCGGISDLHNNL